jgi:hypothetical protein
MRWHISSVADVRTWAANTLDVNGEQAGRVARAVWSRPDFPHPTHHADLTDYLGSLDDDWLYDQADNANMIY